MYGTYGFTEAKEKGRDGTPMRGGSRTPCEARPSLARGRHPAGVTARGLFARVVDTLFSMTYVDSLRSVFALIHTGNGLHAARGVLVSTSGHECERQGASASRVLGYLVNYCSGTAVTC